MTSVMESTRVEEAVRGYIDSWHRGDADGTARSLHDHQVTRWQMVASTDADDGGDPDTAVKIVVNHVEEDIACARVSTPDYLDYVHLVRTHAGWRIVHDLSVSR